MCLSVHSFLKQAAEVCRATQTDRTCRTGLVPGTAPIAREAIAVVQAPIPAIEGAPTQANEEIMENPMRHSDLFRTARTGVLVALVTCSPVLAQEIDDEAAFDDALSQFGHAGGAAWQCSDEAGQSTILGQVSDVFHRLTQLFGTERAFTFAAAFGAGTVDTIEAADCDGYIVGFADGLEAGIPEEGVE